MGFRETSGFGFLLDLKAEIVYSSKETCKIEERKSKINNWFINICLDR